jgi:hypothetical protein
MKQENRLDQESLNNKGKKQRESSQKYNRQAPSGAEKLYVLFSSCQDCISSARLFIVFDSDAEFARATKQPSCWSRGSHAVQMTTLPSTPLVLNFLTVPPVAS